ncbi:NAD(P)/FAD-dependent oxidoreductase [Noviherbaspirillum sp.]|uniref:NAD(P)/FAD-dependent oxidoreductase n=1 Tax=Noviherbaspirillum sp. TaxID=1926288 RepID=UPI002D39F2B0|nr:FAD-dependent oxidoreductase [Noviherbaspirillum sp.]HZW21376.1 FAD-dependent oxidoreductase [Noviherbaspirillum sp.]
MNTATHPITIIGAGIVGLCVAYSLRKEGFAVQVIDPEDPGSQCSFGNAGAISTGSVAPLAMPGVLKNAAKMLLEADSPLYVPPHYWLRAAPWLQRFVASATPQRVEEIASALTDLFAGALDNHRALAREIGCPQRVVQTGQLHLYRNAAALEKDAGSWRLRERHGVRCERLDAAAIRALEPAVSSDYTVAMFMPEQGAVTHPFAYAQAIAEAARQRGVVFVRDRVQGLSREAGGWRVQGAQRGYQASQVVLAAGAWSAPLLRPLGLRVPLESQRGYHLHLSSPNLSIGRPIVFADRKVFAAPMEHGLRISGTVEFGGLKMPPTPRRAAALGDAAVKGLPGLELDAPSMWMGHRPCLPDSLPVLGPVRTHPGLWCAFGHGHLGVTGSVNTGRWIADAAAGRMASERFAPFAVERF